MSMTKKGLIFSWAVSLALSVVTVILFIATDKDISGLVTLCGFSFGETAVYDAVYAWKAKAENRAKYAQKFVSQMAEQYGIESVASILGIVLQD